MRVWVLKKYLQSLFLMEMDIGLICWISLRAYWLIRFYKIEIDAEVGSRCVAVDKNDRFGLVSRMSVEIIFQEILNTKQVYFTKSLYSSNLVNTQNHFYSSTYLSSAFSNKKMPQKNSKNKKANLLNPFRKHS